MSNISTLPAKSAPFKIDAHKGTCVSTVSRQWATRPDDQKFLSLSDLRDQVHTWADESSVCPVLPKDIQVGYGSDQTDLRISVAGAELEPSHYAFDSLARLADAPANYLRGLPAPLAALNLGYGLRAAEQSEVAAYIRSNGSRVLRGLTSMRYGRIFDWQVVDAVMKVAGNGTGDTRWKVPGVIDWSNSTYNPNVDITKQTTTLYASDRDVFLFLVDDRNPIEIGKLADGSPDYVFRGFYVWNSEVGARTFGFATMFLRGVCQNRNLWGVEQFAELTFRHTAAAPERFASEVGPALLAYADSSATSLVSGINMAKQTIVAVDAESRLEFLGRQGFSQKAAARIVATHELEEQRPPASVWDMAQGITAVARTEQYQEARIALERIAGKLLQKAAA